MLRVTQSVFCHFSCFDSEYSFNHTLSLTHKHKQPHFLITSICSLQFVRSTKTKRQITFDRQRRSLPLPSKRNHEMIIIACVPDRPRHLRNEMKHCFNIFAWTREGGERVRRWGAKMFSRKPRARNAKAKKKLNRKKSWCLVLSDAHTASLFPQILCYEPRSAFVGRESEDLNKVAAVFFSLWHLNNFLCSVYILRKNPSCDFVTDSSCDKRARFSVSVLEVT